jgi:DUSAM domain-containing protein
MRDLLLSAAPTVVISSADAEAALATTESATALLLEIRKRIREGSNRITRITADQRGWRWVSVRVS